MFSGTWRKVPQIVSAYHRTPLPLLKTFCVFLTWELAIQKKYINHLQSFCISFIGVSDRYQIGVSQFLHNLKFLIFEYLWKFVWPLHKKGWPVLQPLLVLLALLIPHPNVLLTPERLLSSLPKSHLGLIRAPHANVSPNYWI